MGDRFTVAHASWTALSQVCECSSVRIRMWPVQCVNAFASMPVLLVCMFESVDYVLLGARITKHHRAAVHHSLLDASAHCVPRGASAEAVLFIISHLSMNSRHHPSSSVGPQHTGRQGRQETHLVKRWLPRDELVSQHPHSPRVHQSVVMEVHQLL